MAAAADRPQCPACRADLHTCGYLIGGRTLRPVVANVMPPPPRYHGYHGRAKGKSKGRSEPESTTPRGATEYVTVESPPIQIANAELMVNTEFGKT